jgi:acetoin utilization protein AcuB
MSLDARGGGGAASPEAMMRVNELMSAPAATVAPGDSLHIADGMMSMGGVRHLPVVSNGALVGVISQRDILRAPGLLSHLLSTARAALRSLRVQDVMSVELVTIGADAPVEEAAQKLLEHRVGCLPVVEAGALVGIVTTSDLLRALAGPPEAADAVVKAANRSSAAPAPAVKDA